MKSLGALVLVCLASCGDNSRQCGPGTTENNGVCEPEGTAGLICGDGTVLDELTDECVPDPSVCGGGTVLINGTCQDPTSGFPIDLMEGPEPNGFEIDATPAGLIELKPIGEAFVLKGCVAPTGINAPDLDVYEFDVAAPTLLHVAADGVEGLAAGFLVVGDSPQLGSWFRLGINLSTDASKRELFLPVAGHYQLVMTDSRTLLPLTQNGEGLPAAGNPDGTSCYFVTINQRAIPAVEALDLDVPTTGTIGEELRFFSGNFPTGLNTMRAVIDPEDLDGDGIPDLDELGNPIDSHAASSIVLMNNNQFRQVNDADATTPESFAIFGGIKAGDSPTIVLDYVWNIAITPAAFSVEVLEHTASQSLSTTGTAVNATSNGQAFDEFDDLNLFDFDVAAAGDTLAMDLAFSIPVQGSVVDQDGLFVSPFTGFNGVATFTSYKGLLRAFGPGRHYFVLFAPRNSVGTAFAATSTISTLAPTPIPVGTPVTGVAFNAVKSNLFSFDGGSEPWHSFNASADTTIGTLGVQIFDPAVSTPQTPGFAFGRLDLLQTTVDASPPSNRQPDSTPLIATTFARDGTTPTNVILRNPFATLPPAATELFVKVNPTIASPTGVFAMDFAIRQHEDFGGPIAAGQTANDSATMTAGSEERYFVETVAGNRVAISVQPNGSQPALNLVIDRLAPDESVLESFPAAGPNLGTSFDVLQNLGGFQAFRVRGASGASAGDYTVTATVTSDSYTAVQAPAGFSDACIGGSSLQIDDDEGFSAAIAAPSGFELHGTAVTNFLVSSNGFLTFNVGAPDPLLDNTPIAASADVAIAPHWDDLGGVSVCTKVLAGGQRVIQWDGFSFDTFRTVQFQAILDGNGKITFVYGPAHEDSGTTATIGVQDSTNALELGFLSAVEVAASSITLTPN